MDNGTRNTDSRLLSPREAARALDTSVSTLARWRQEGKGPRYFKLGDGQFSRVKYRVSDVRAFLEAGAVERGRSDRLSFDDADVNTIESVEIDGRRYGQFEHARPVPLKDSGDFGTWDKSRELETEKGGVVADPPADGTSDDEAGE